jgi:hypothetical protein
MIQDFANIRAKEEDINVELLGFKTSYRDYERSQDSHFNYAQKSNVSKTIFF